MLNYIWIYTFWPCTVWIKNVSNELSFTQSNYNADSNAEFDSGLSDNESQDEDYQPDAPPNKSIVKGILGFGVRVNSALYVDGPLRKMLKIYSLAEITTTYPGTSVNQISLFKEAAQLGVFKSFNIILDAADPNNLYPYFGKTHKTYIVCNDEVTKDEIIAFLASNDVIVGEGRVPYKANLTSFSWRKT
jgi:hypothetical protein